MMPRGGLAKTDRKERFEVREGYKKEVEEAWAAFDPASMPSLKLRVYEKAYDKVVKQNIGSFTELIAVEEEFDLPRHTLSKYLEWKRKLPSELPSEQVKSKADLMKAKRARETVEASEAAKKQELEHENLKAKAQEAILERYTDSLDGLMLQAVQATLTHAEQQSVSLEIACKKVRVCARLLHLCILIQSQ